MCVDCKILFFFNVLGRQELKVIVSVTDYHGNLNEEQRVLYRKGKQAILSWIILLAPLMQSANPSLNQNSKKLNILESK